MRCKLIEHQEGEMLTITIEGTAMGTRITAQLSGKVRYAMIDGLLWWAINRKLDAVVAACMHRIDHSNMEHAAALHVGEALDHYVHTAPWGETTQERDVRILALVQKHLPELAPLTQAMPEAQAEIDELAEITAILRSRIANEGDAGHGIEKLITIVPESRAA